ncbi:UNVERIFIED_CONTAM: hypothetical protein Slati_3975300 [Sesamum latifolium]|uniref:Retrotransposon protein n=1 Tax=Sesamum latifolium TaxID=2727402 RepID=A0AAW2TPS4_9LAMI
MEGLKAEHETEVEQLQEENQQLRDQVNDLRDHIDQLAEMIPDELEEDPEQDAMEHQDDDGELTDGNVTDEEKQSGVSVVGLKGTKGTVSLAIYYNRFPTVPEGYSDTSWIAKKTPGVMGAQNIFFTLGGGAVSWKSAKQTLITRSTFEAELCALDKTGTETEWLFGLLSQLVIVSQSFPPFVVRCDSQTTIAKVRSRTHNQKDRTTRPS